MVIRHSLSYFIARGLPGIVTFLGVAVYTRLLSPESYGEYALVIATAGLAYTVLFNWLPLSLSRFFHSPDQSVGALLRGVLVAYSALVVAAGCGVTLAALLSGSIGQARLFFLGWAVLCARGWFEINKELVRSRLEPRRYGAIEATKAVLAVVAGSLLAYFGLGSTGVLLGFVLGLLTSTLWNGGSLRQLVNAGRDETARMRPLLEYGLPLSVAFAFEFVVSGSDRLLLGWLTGVDSAGLYAAGYDLPRQITILLMNVINLAAYPLVVRAYEQQGEAAAQAQMKRNAVLLLAISAPTVAGLMALAPGLSALFLGPSFRESAIQLIPWVAVATMLDGFRMYFVNLAFHLKKRTGQQILVVASAAVANVFGNFLLIPRLGAVGAAVSTLGAYALALGLAYILARRHWRFEWPTIESLQIGTATLAMVAVLVLVRASWPTILAAVAGALVYFLSLFFANFAEMRSRIRGRLEVGARGGS